MTGTWINGRLVADVEERQLNDKTLTRFTVASNDGDRALFLPVEMWNRENLGRYIGKGSQVLVAGYLKQNEWEANNGEKKKRIVMVGQRVDFLDPAPGKRNGG